MKERLIGAVVLVALGVWLIPWLLDGPDETGAEDESALSLPVPEGQIGELRTEVIDLSARAAAGGEATARAATSTPAAASAPPRRTLASGASAAGTISGDAHAEGTGPSGAMSASARESAAEDSAGAQAAAAPSSAPAQGDRSDAAEAPAAKTPAASAPAAETVAAPSSAAEGDWAVQLGSFGDEQNAQRLAERIRGLGYTPRISDFRSGGRVMYRVRLGTHRTRAEAERAASSLSASGFVAQVVTAD